MKTPMNVFNTALKKKKNRKGFSLVELIVVLVIMAILSAALIGYISKTKEQNVQSECQASVTAAQTIASGIYASAEVPASYKFTDGSGNSHTVTAVGSALGSTDGASDVAALAEVPAANITKITVNAQGLVTGLVYTSGGKTCTYARTDVTAPGTYTNS